MRPRRFLDVPDSQRVTEQLVKLQQQVSQEVLKVGCPFQYIIALLFSTAQWLVGWCADAKVKNSKPSANYHLSMLK